MPTPIAGQLVTWKPNADAPAGRPERDVVFSGTAAAIVGNYVLVIGVKRPLYETTDANSPGFAYSVPVGLILTAV